MSEMTQFQAARHIANLTGSGFRLPHGAQNVHWRFLDATLTMRYDTVKIQNRRGREIITPKNRVLHVWTKGADGWTHEVIPVKAGEEAEVVYRDVPTPLEQAVTARHEAMAGGVDNRFTVGTPQKKGKKNG